MVKRIGIVMFLLLALGVAMAANLNQFGVADVRQVTFSTQVKVGDTVLPAGEYRVSHNMNGDEHVMFFQQTNVSKNKQASAKVKCVLKSLDQPAKENLSGFREEAGVQVLTVLQFKGDKAQHVF